MATVLKNVLNFTGLVVGVPSALPHLINVNGLAQVPRVILAEGAGGYTITADSTNVTVTRGVNAAAALTCYCEAWHSIEDSEPLPGGIALTNYPIVIQGNSVIAGGGGAGGTLSAVEFNHPSFSQNAGSGTLMTVNRVSISAPMSATVAALMFDLPAAGTGSQNLTYGVGVYTMAGSTMSLVSNASLALTYNTANDTNFSGPRWRTLAGNFNLTAGEYMLGAFVAASTTFGQTVYGGLKFFPAAGAPEGGFADGLVSSAASILSAPASLVLSQISQTGLSVVNFGGSVGIPTVRFAGTF